MPTTVQCETALRHSHKPRPVSWTRPSGGRLARAGRRFSQGQPSCNDEQQRQAARQVRNRVRRVLARRVKRKTNTKVKVHEILRAKISGQLPDRG